MNEKMTLSTILNRTSNIGGFHFIEESGCYNDSVQGFGGKFQVFFDPKRYKVCVDDTLVDVIVREDVLSLAEERGAKYKYYPKWENKNCFNFNFKTGHDEDAQNNMVEFVRTFTSAFDAIYNAFKQEDEQTATEQKSEEPVEEKKSAKRVTRKKKTAEKQTEETVEKKETPKKTARRRTSKKAGEKSA